MLNRSWKAVKADMDAITRARGEDPEARSAEARRKTNAYIAGYRPGELRKRAGVTQVELASRMGISQARVSQLEKGDPEQFVVDTIHRYVNALGGELALGATSTDAGSRSPTAPKRSTRSAREPTERGTRQSRSDNYR